jgi:hypothetical protein
LCGSKGTHTKLISKLEKCSYKTAQEIAKRYSENIFVESESDLTDFKQTEIPKGFTKRFGKLHVNYLVSRGFDAERVIKEFDLYASTVAGDYRFKILAPIYNNYKLVNYQMRTIAHVDPKYISCKDELATYRLKDCLYNIDRAKGTAVLCEGITDVWKIGDGAVGLFGKTITAEQVLLLLRSGIERVIICLDSVAKDPDSPKNRAKILGKLAGLFASVEVLEIDKGDPGDMSELDLRNLRKIAGIR